MTTRRIITRVPPAKLRAEVTPITRLEARPIVEVLPYMGQDPRWEPVRRDTSVTPSDVARSAVWGNVSVPALDVVTLEALVANSLALSVACRRLVAVMTKREPSREQIRAVLREAHGRAIDTALGIDCIREVLR